MGPIFPQRHNAGDGFVDKKYYHLLFYGYEKCCAYSISTRSHCLSAVRRPHNILTSAPRNEQHEYPNQELQLAGDSTIQVFQQQEWQDSQRKQ